MNQPIEFDPDPPTQEEVAEAAEFKYGPLHAADLKACSRTEAGSSDYLRMKEMKWHSHSL